MKRTLPVALWLLLCGHATVTPGTSRPGAYERYTLRVPNESEVATVRVEMDFPAEVRVISFVDVPGWKLVSTMDSTGRATRAVWTGTLPPDRFVEFPFMGVNPKTATSVSWPVTQVYANGDKVEWKEAPGERRPASVTVIAEPASPSSAPSPFAFAALAIATLSLALTLMSRANAARSRS